MSTQLSGASGLTTEICQMSAMEIAAAIRSGRLSSREVLEAHLDRIHVINPAVSAITTVLEESSLEAAATADAAVADGDDLPPLHGVPFTVKENIDLVGAPTTQGLRALRDAYPTRDAPVVARMRAAGAIPIAHTNCPTIAVRWHTESELWGATFNPWDRSRTPGGSSGGEAAAVATGMSPWGLGNDGLGSLRWPAQCCGVVSLKPTLGRIPHAGPLEPTDPAIGVQLTSVEGPLARRVEVLRVALEILAGPSWRDPWAVPAPLRGPPPDDPIRVAVVVDPAGQGIATPVLEGVRNAESVLADAGYVLEEVEPPSIDAVARLLLDMLNTPEIRAMWEMTSSMLPADTQRFLVGFYRAAGDADPVAAMRVFSSRTALARAWGEFQERYPLILGPISTAMPFELGSDLGDDRVSQTIVDLRLTLAVNALGLPAVAVPVGLTDGLPQAIQVIGGRYREDLCLDAAEAIEARLGILTPIDPVWLKRAQE